MAEKNIRITEKAHKALEDVCIENPLFKMGQYASIAIIEKTERERTHENVVLERNINKTV